MEEKLTEREITVLYLATQGKSNKIIAKELYITESTVRKHLHSCYNKLNVSCRIQASLKAIYIGYFSLKDVI